MTTQPHSPTRVFIQARMSSSRFPGKVLAPLCGKPMILHLLERLHRVMPKQDVVVLTSTEPSDDPLFVYLSSLHLPVFRGDLLNTFQRFRSAVQEFPCDQFFRISGDSPLFLETLIPDMLSAWQEKSVDVMTNVFPRTYPKGQSLELINTNVFLNVDIEKLSQQDCEHVTPYFYNHPDQFSIFNLENPNPSQEMPNVVVDTVEEYHFLEENWEALTASS